MYKWSNKEILFLKENYKVLSKKEMSRILNIPYRSVCYKSFVLNLHKEKSISKEKFFDTWDSDMAYVFGFLVADGCICSEKKGSYAISLKLSIKDIDILMKIKFLLGVNKIRFLKKGKTVESEKEADQVMFRIHSKYMFDRLNELGMEQNKTYKTININIPDNYILDFLRGFTDGDGSITISYGSKGYPFLRWIVYQHISSEDFLFYLKKKIKDLFNIDVKYGIQKKSNENWDDLCMLYAYSFNAIKLLDKIYQNNSLCIKRKYDNYIKFKEYFNSQDKGKLVLKGKLTETITIPLEVRDV